MQPFVDRDGATQGSIEVVEVSDENRKQLEHESSDLRSRIAVLVSASPSPIRADVERMLLGDGGVTVEEIATARDEVTSYYDDHC